MQAVETTITELLRSFPGTDVIRIEHDDAKTSFDVIFSDHVTATRVTVSASTSNLRCEVLCMWRPDNADFS